MLIKQLNRIFLYIATACLISSSLHFKTMADSSEKSRETKIILNQKYEIDRQRIIEFYKSRDIVGMEELAEQIRKIWNKDDEQYILLMTNISLILKNFNFDNDKQFGLSQKYALLVLGASTKLPIDTELALVLCLNHNSGYLGYTKVINREVQSEEWIKERAYKAKLWLHAWQRLEKEIDRKFNFDDPQNEIELNVAPPPVTGLPSGVAPESIKDPKLRAEYETAIAKNTEKIQKANTQNTLRNLDKRISKRAEEFIIAEYSIKPYNLKELRQLLNGYQIGNDRKIRIVKAVKKNTGETDEKSKSTIVTPATKPKSPNTTKPMPPAKPVKQRKTN